MTEDEATEGTEIGTVSVTGGTAPYSYEVTGTDADKFEVEGTTIKLADTLTQGNYTAAVKATDSKNKEKTSEDFDLEVTEY